MGVGRRGAVVVSVVVAVLVAVAVSCAPPSSITGVVTDGRGTPVSGATVTVHSLWAPYSLETTTDADGRYVHASLPPAMYRIEVHAGPAYEATWFPSVGTVGESTPVSVTGDAVATADVVLRDVPPPPPPPPPLHLGSATNGFGNQLDAANCAQGQPSSVAPCGPQPMVWAAINGPYQNYDNGDPYATKCASGGSSGQANRSTCDHAAGPANANGLYAANPLYRDTGYSYAVDVAPADVGQPLTVAIYDFTSSYRTIDQSSPYTGDCNSNAAPFNSGLYTSGASGWGASQCQTGDSGGNWTGTGSRTGGAARDINDLNMDAALYENDGNDATTSSTTVQSSATSTACHLQALGGIAVAPFKNTWVPVCTFVPTAAGVFPLRIKASGIPGVADNGDAYNAFALRVTGGTATTVRPLDEMSLWLNTPGSGPRVYLADVDSTHAGQTLDVDLYDVGDGSGSSAFTLRLMAPPSGAPAVVPTTGASVPCSYNATPSTTIAPATPDQSATCTVTTKPAGSGAGIYNGKWLRLSVAIPSDYQCTSDCWWTIRYDTGSAGVPTDRTVWSVKVS